MLLTLGGEAIGVLGILGGGLGAGLWLDTDTLQFGPYVYGLAGAGLGAFGGGVVELGVYRDLDAFTGRGAELGAAAGRALSVGANASYHDGAGASRAGLAGDVGLGAGLGVWALRSATWALRLGGARRQP